MMTLFTVVKFGNIKANLYRVLCWAMYFDCDGNVIVVLLGEFTKTFSVKP